MNIYIYQRCAGPNKLLTITWTPPNTQILFAVQNPTANHTHVSLSLLRPLLFFFFSLYRFLASLIHSLVFNSRVTRACKNQDENPYKNQRKFGFLGNPWFTFENDFDFDRWCWIGCLVGGEMGVGLWSACWRILSASEIMVGDQEPEGMIVLSFLAFFFFFSSFVVLWFWGSI